MPTDGDPNETRQTSRMERETYSGGIRAIRQ